ncbi:FliM/FliN family flagellar motor C-terminal domain-containing protein [Ruegeria sp. EL01]|jgi:flagellar motor switch protein FliM|uniref:FliM/FliN family flagellar motor C-terminal domain-containing protein n=1 Tax=Ruegeria sp. EL01 TaxID=2107578 RepID=UPI000EA8309B|nr:flagellar motor switch protein FliM [Ruegeria sp. EL01]
MAHSVSAALARKLSVGQDDLSDRPRSVLRALRLGVARAAGDRLNLPLAVIGVRQSNRPQNEAIETLGEDWLLLLFSGPEGVAAACLDPSCVSAIVQTQTMGEVMADPPSARAFTDTDAAMAAPLIEEALMRAATLVEAAADQDSLTGYDYRSRSADLRNLSLALVEDTYRAFELTVDLAGGVRQGQITVLLPDHPFLPEEADASHVESGPNLEHSAGVVRAELNAVLCRMALPLANLSGLKVGDVVPLTGSRLDRTEILSIDRKRAAVGRLGQCGGLRAIRVNEHAPLPALADTEAAEFVASKTRAPQQDIQDASDLVPDTLDVTSYKVETPDPEPLESELDFANSDQIAAEISQLAGLAGAEDGPERSG